MVATHKEESDNKKIWDKVWARAMVVTALGEGMVELEQQIAKLMAALTKAKQGNSPSSAPNSPKKGAMEGDAIVVALQVIQYLTMEGVALDRQPQPVAYLLGMRQGTLGMGAMPRVARDLMQGGKAWPIIGIQTPCNALGARGRPHGQGMPYPSDGF